MSDEKYDSSVDTLMHMRNVSKIMNVFICGLSGRASVHDKSKLEKPEKPIYDKYTPMLKGLTFGSEPYDKVLHKMKKGIKEHYKRNRHHPEHFPYGINDMNLLDIIEMFCDWMAATLRHDDGDIFKSIDICRDRFNMSPQLAEIFINTAKGMKNAGKVSSSSS